MRVIWFLLLLLTILSPIQAGSTSAKQVQLDDKEKAWIKQHPVINFTGDPDWLPFEGFTKEGEYIGIISDILKLYQQKTSLKFNVIPTKSWSESVSLLETGKVDMMTVSDSWTDPQYLYTKSIIPNDIVIVMKSGHPYVDSLYYLQYDTIAIIKGYRYLDEIKKKYPEYTFYEVKNIQEGLEGVASGKYDALLASMAIATYTIDKMQLGNVDVVGKTEFKIKVKFAVRKAFAPLVGILNKIHVGEKEGHAILKGWTYQKYVEKTDYTLITELIMLLLIVLMAAVILYLLLKRRTQKHKSTEGLLSHTQKEINSAAKYAMILDNLYAVNSDNLHTFFDDSFNISNPKNIKSSTFTYFKALDDNHALLILIDARGESIDGILNAMFIKTLLKRVLALSKERLLHTDPATLLSMMDEQLRLTLDKMDTRIKPENIGFDAAAVTIDKTANTIGYAGANISLFYTQDHKVMIARADKHSVNGDNTRYTNHHIDIISTMDFYLLSRGYLEQSGGKQDLPFGKRRAKEIIGRYENHNLDVQKNALIDALREYIGKHPRAGDITLLGFRITQQ